MSWPEPELRSLRISARELVYQTLVHWIIAGTLAPGEKIPIEQLQETLGVSRTPIREALQLAEQDRLVTVAPGRESIVEQVDPENWAHVVGPIAVLEKHAAANAAMTITEDAIADLTKINERMRAVLGAGDIDAADECDMAFHQRILDVVGNRFLEDLLRRLNLHRRWYVRVLHPEARPTAQSCDQHDDIIAALQAHDPEAAAAAMARNWARTQQVGLASSDAVDAGA